MTVHERSFCRRNLGFDAAQNLDGGELASRLPWGRSIAGLSRGHADPGSARILSYRAVSPRLECQGDEGANDYPLQIDDLDSDYEFRVEGALSTWFLVGTFSSGYTNSERFDAKNRYRINLSDPTAPVVAASEEDWNSAAVVPLIRKSIFPPYPAALGPDFRIAFNGFEFKKERRAFADIRLRFAPLAGLGLAGASKHDICG
jgi:hypothetical protein